MSGDFIALAPIWFLAFLFSLSAHEAAHALTAKWGGDRTAYSMGQVTLNPLPHIQREPVGMILFPIITYFLQGFMMGWASAPLDPYWIIRNPKPAAWVALAGPMANLGIALLAAMIIIIGLSVGIFQYPPALHFSSLIIGDGFLLEPLSRFISILFSLNVVLFTFNLIPFPPFDGAMVIGLFLPEELALKVHTAMFNPQFSFFGILIAWFLSGYIISPVYRFSLSLLLSLYP